MPEEEPLTPIEESRAAYGQVFLRIKNGYYMGFYTSMNAKKKKPTGMGTKGFTAQEIPATDEAQEDVSGQYKLVAYPTRLWVESDDDMLDHPNISELTHDEWKSILPEPDQI